MLRIIFLIVICCYCNSCQPEKKDAGASTTKTLVGPSKAKNTDATAWNITAVTGSILVFGNGRTIDTRLADLNYIGQVPIQRQAPFIIYSGRYCSDCDARTMLYISQADDSVKDVRYGKNRLMHPGIMKDYQTGEILYKARTFYGTVLLNTTGIIWYQESLSDYGSFIPNIFLVKLDESGRTDTSFAFNNENLQQTIALFEKGACKEIKGLEYLSEP